MASIPLAVHSHAYTHTHTHTHILPGVRVSRFFTHCLFSFASQLLVLAFKEITKWKPQTKRERWTFDSRSSSSVQGWMRALLTIYNVLHMNKVCLFIWNAQCSSRFGCRAMLYASHMSACMSHICQQINKSWMHFSFAMCFLFYLSLSLLFSFLSLLVLSFLFSVYINAMHAHILFFFTRTHSSM